ncbi:MAG: hypothetical protein LBH71_04350, partial [Oscillospiraceae bacterium]|nr:hypothetical protein [Oscillospiraceae bacterium]
MKKNIGIIFADDLEYLPFYDYAVKSGYGKSDVRSNECIHLQIGERQIFAVKSGIGKVNAAASACDLIHMGADLILNAGLSGAVSNLSRGDVAAGISYVECDFDLTVFGYKKGE